MSHLKKIHTHISNKHGLTPKKILCLVVAVALAIMLVDWYSGYKPEAPRGPVDDSAIRTAMSNYLVGYSLAQSGFVPALATSTPQCSGPLLLNEAPGGNLVVFGKSCENPRTVLCQELDMTAGGPRIGSVSSLSDEGDFGGRYSCQ